MGKKPRHRELKEKPLGKQKPELSRKPGTVVVGKAYALEDIMKLLADLRSEERDRAITASVQFMSDNHAIADALSKTPDLNMTDLTKEVLEIVKREQKLILEVLKETKRLDALRYLAKSERVPTEIHREAENIIRKIEPTKPEKPKLPEKKEKVPEVKAFPPAKVKTLWRKLDSRDSSIRINAAVTVFTYYSEIAKAMPKVPMLTITQLLIKAKDITFRNTDPVFREMMKTWNRAALGFLATSGSIPPEISKRAAELLKRAPERPSGVRLPVSGVLGQVSRKPETEHRKPEADEPEKKVVIGEKELLAEKPEPAPIRFDEPKVKQLWKDLNSKNIKTKIQAAIRVFTEYQDVARVLPSIPMLTVSQVIDKASDIASKNMGMFFKKLSDARNRKALEFISQSQAVPPALSKKAKEVLEILLQEEEKEERISGPRVTFKEGGGPEDES